MWNRDKYHIIWSAKNLIKNTKKRTIEYISQAQSKAWTWNYIFHVPVHLPSNCYQTRTQSPLSCNKQMTQLAIRQKLYIYIYILLWLAKKYSFLYQKMYFHHYFCFLSRPKHISLTIICKTRSITFPKTTTSALYYFKS